AANVSFTAAHQRVVFEVTRAYLRLSAARAQTAVARDALQRTRGIAKAAEARRERGLATTVEVVEGRSEVAQGEYGLAQGTAGAGWLGAKSVGEPWATATVPNVAALMTFEWTLFDFGVRQAHTEIARSRSNEAEQVVEKLQRQATQEVVAAYDEVNANLAR